MSDSLGLALIAKDEQGTLPNLLASIEGAFDFTRTIILGRRGTGAAIRCSEDGYNLEPAHEPDPIPEDQRPSPLTRQRRRAEARKRAKGLTAR